MADNAKPWWDSSLDWSLPTSSRSRLRNAERTERSLPQAVDAYHLGKTAIEVESDPVVKISGAAPKPLPEPAFRQGLKSQGSGTHAQTKQARIDLDAEL